MSEDQAAPASPSLPGATLPRRLRLRSQRHFRRVYQRGRRAGGQWLSVVAWFGRHDPQDPGLKDPRLGVSVSKDHGGAVRRNKIKRLLREAFRLERHRLPPVDLVLIPRQRSERYPLAELRQELVELLRRLQHAPGKPRGPRRRERH